MTKTPPLNQILYGPPGTGKTFEAINATLEILAPEYLAENQFDRSRLKARFDELQAAGYVRFVTFHQSFSYEDFVEGIRAEPDESDKLHYSVADGVFKSLCEAAVAKVTKATDAPLSLEGRRVWKMSLGNTLGADASIYEECIKNGYALLGYGQTIDFTGVQTREDIYQRFLANGEDVKKDSYAVTAVTTFILKMRRGDLIVVTDGNTKFRAIGQVTGDYRSVDRRQNDEDYGQCRDVEWLRTYSPSLPLDQLMTNQFSQMTIYELRPDSIDLGKLAALLRAKDITPFRVGESFNKYEVVRVSDDLLELRKPNGNRLPLGMGMLQDLANYVRAGELTIGDIREKRVLEKLPGAQLEPNIVNGYNNILPSLVDRLLTGTPTHSQPNSTNARVLIIDEINRGNISRIFGELITLSEPSKRAGAPEALQVVLPYSKSTFSVPANLYIIGTMNTADRSLSGLDLALRRRFTFKEMPPRPDLLRDLWVDGVNIGELLRVMNERIEVLLDRDHCIGHAYFMSLGDGRTADVQTLSDIFRNSIIPLLQEYFFEDWQRIHWVLNDHRKAVRHRFLTKAETNVSSLFGDVVGVNTENTRWVINHEAFGYIESYAGVIEVQPISAS